MRRICASLDNISTCNVGTYVARSSFPSYAFIILLLTAFFELVTVVHFMSTLTSS